MSNKNIIRIQTAWVSSRWSQWGTRCWSESQRETEGFVPSVTHGWAKKCCYGQKNMVQYVVVCPRLQLTSHTQPTSPLSRIKYERYIFFIKKCVRLFIEVRHYVWSCSVYICICICMWLYNIHTLFVSMYICIYIVIHRQTVSFYQNSSVWLDTQDARNRDRNPSNFTLDWFQTCRPPSGSRWLREFLRYFILATAAAFVYIFNTLSASRVLNSFEELCITAADNSFARELNPHGGAYIVIHRQTVSFYQNSSVWLDTLDARSRDRNPSNFLR